MSETERSYPVAPARYVLRTVDGTTTSALTLPELLETCGELPVSMWDDIRMLAPGETLRDGGGAAPTWSITRMEQP